jgi:hypothetical protein
MRKLPSLIVCLTVAGLAGMKAPRPVVGTILSAGSFHVDHVTGTGTATVLNGDAVETSDNASRILLRNGVALNLSPRSGGSVFTDHATLETGTLQIKSTAAAFPIDSRAFTVTPTTPGTVATLQVAGNTLTVNVASGNAQIASASGQTLAHLTAGLTLAFDSLAAAAADGPEMPVRLLGVLDAENGHYLIRDRFSNTVSEVVGPVEPKLIHRMVSVDGKTFINQKSLLPHADRLVHVSKLSASDASMGLPCAGPGAGGVAKLVEISGVVSKVRDHFVMKTAQNKVFELTGDIQDKQIGSTLHTKGFVLPPRATVLPAENVVYLEPKKFVAMSSPCVGSVVGASLVSTGIVTATAVTANAAVNPISF